MATQYIAFIRNVMLGRQGLSRKLLIESFRKSGAENVVSHFATGNVSFELEPEQSKKFKTLIEFQLEGILFRHEPVFIRSLGELEPIDFEGIFSSQAYKDEVYERCVSFLDSEADIPLPVAKKRNDVEIFSQLNNHLFSVTRLVNNRPGGPNKLIETMTRQPASTRNINIVIRILDKLTG